MEFNLMLFVALFAVPIGWFIIATNQNRPSTYSWHPWMVGRRPVTTVDGFERSNVTLMRRKTNDGRWIYRDMTTAEREDYVEEQLWLNSW